MIAALAAALGAMVLLLALQLAALVIRQREVIDLP
jgi:hypothetical protein